MGYAGYAPGANSLMAASLSDLQRALRAMPLDMAEAALELIEQLTRNTVRSPKEEKFRRIKLSNKKIAAAITEVAGAVDVLRAMGWVDGEVAEDGGATMVLPPNVTLDFNPMVTDIIEAKDYYKKEIQEEKRRQARADRVAEDPEKQALMKQILADQKEMAAKGPETRSSVAKQLGNGTVMRAADIGIGKSSGGG